MFLSELKDTKSIVYIPGSSEKIQKAREKYIPAFTEHFKNVGIQFDSSIIITPEMNSDEAQKAVREASFIMLMGGDPFKQKEMCEKLGLLEELKKYDVYAKTGIIYTYNGESQYSGSDSLSILRSSVHFGIPRTLDIKKTVRVQAWIDMPLGTVVKNMHDGAFWSLLLFFGVLLWASFSSWEVEDPDKVKFGKMLLNKEAKKMTIDGKECPLRNQEFQLLLMFVEKPDHTLSREEIKNAFWKEEQGVDNRVSNLISTLRGSLKEYQGYQIVTEGNVFRLWTN